MKRTAVFSILVVLCLMSNLIAEENGSDFGIKFSGYVKTDVMLDSRQTVAPREGHFLLYPVGISTDINGDDINEKVNLNMLAIQTRLKGTITAPDAFGAKTAGVIEAAFFGQSEGDINGFRLRHAFFTLTWEKTSLMIGQFWHPMFVTSCFPGTVSFNTGAPFQPFSRNPQIRLTRTAGNLKIIGTAISQRDFVSMGPAGSSSIYLRNAAIPNLNLQFQLSSKNHLFGLGGDWKALAPRLATPKGYKSTELVTATSFMGFASFKLPKFTWKFEGVYGQNLTDHLMLGGYAVDSRDASTGVETYMPTGVFSAWTEISGGKKIELGCFLGYTQNLGAADEIKYDIDDSDIGSIWARGTNIDVIYRIAPRIIWNCEKTSFATEIEYTAASYGTTDIKGKVNDAEFVGNLRILLAAYYFF